jgi:pimeloyl-ACP methyl ester carboxylesterase
VTVNGVSLAVLDEGSGDPPFVFIHGYACDHTAWLPQFRDLSRDHRCVTVDLRGRGESEAAAPYGVAQQAEDVAATIETLGLDPAIVVGHSLGGIVALVLNSRHPELVLGVVCVDSPLRADVLRGASTTSKAIRDDGTMEPMRRMVERFWSESTADAIKEEVRSTMLSCPAEVGAGMLEDADDFAPQMLDLLKAADRKPFMAIWPSRPMGDPVWLRDNLMFLRQEPIAGTGHFLQLERPEMTNALLRAFLDDVERDPRLQRA